MVKIGRQEAVRVFTSAPIAKRYDVFTVETSDGVCILLKGLINKHRSSLNGFPSQVRDFSRSSLLLLPFYLFIYFISPLIFIPKQVSNRFLFGFPSDWEQYADPLTHHNPELQDATLSPEFQHPLHTNVTDELNHKSVAKAPHSTKGISISLHHPLYLLLFFILTLLISVGGQQTDTKQETTHLNKAKRKIIFDTQVTCFYLFQLFFSYLFYFLLPVIVISITY